MFPGVFVAVSEAVHRSLTFTLATEGTRAPKKIRWHLRFRRRCFMILRAAQSPTFGSRLASLLGDLRARTWLRWPATVNADAGKASALLLITPLLVAGRISAQAMMSPKPGSPSQAGKPRPGMCERTPGHKQAPSCVRLLKGAIAEARHVCIDVRSWQSADNIP